MSGLLDRLLGFLELGKDCVTAETLIQMKDLLRRYPHIADVAIASIASISPQVIGCCTFVSRSTLGRGMMIDAYAVSCVIAVFT